MILIDSTMDWFGIVEISTYNLDEVTVGLGEYIYKPSYRVSQ